MGGKTAYDVAKHAERFTLPRLLFRLEECETRDELQATRPEDCWCLGLGGMQQPEPGPWGSSKPRYSGGVELYDDYCPCDDGLRVQTEQAALRQQMIAEHRAAIRLATWRNVGVPPLFADRRYQTHAAGEYAPHVIGALQAEPLASWVLWGLPGVGKTGLSVAYAWEAHLKGRTVLWETLPGMLQKLRKSYQDGSPITEVDLIEPWLACDLLIIDDVGAEYAKPDWMQEKLYQIIGERYNAGMKPVLLTTNLNSAQLADCIGERLMWRVIEMCDHGRRIIELTGPNLRA